jgi:hypothetical protein
MTERWKAWKTKSRFSTLPSAPWKSRKGGEIPTFPQVLLPSPPSNKTGEGGRTVGYGKVEIQRQDSHFPQPRKLPAAQGRRSSKNDSERNGKEQFFRSLPIARFMLILCWNRSRFHAHPWIGKCSVGLRLKVFVSSLLQSAFILSLIASFRPKRIFEVATRQTWGF